MVGAFPGQDWKLTLFGSANPKEAYAKFLSQSRVNTYAGTNELGEAVPGHFWSVVYLHVFFVLDERSS